MAQHRATGRAQMRPLAGSGRGTHRDTAAVSAGVLKAGVLGALAAATIAAPIASAAASPIAAATTRTAASDAGGSAEDVSASPLAGQVRSVGLGLAAPAQAAPAQAAPAAVARASGAPVALPAGSAEQVTFGDVGAGTPTVSVAPEVETAADGEQVDAPAPNSDGYMAPVDAPITSDFGWRIHPTLGYSKLHDGIDYGAACGTPVHAARGGTVVAVETTSASGNRVLVDHGNGVTTGYFHLSGFSTQVGAHVEQGDVVGSVGSTGRSTGCHLHYSVIDSSGQYINPLSLQGE